MTPSGDTQYSRELPHKSFLPGVAWHTGGGEGKEVYLQLTGTPLIAAPTTVACALRGDETAQTVDLLRQVGVQLLRG